MIKFLHIADCHTNIKNRDESIKSLIQIKERCLKDKGIEFLIMAGDFWDQVVSLTRFSPVSEAIEIIKEIAEKIPIIMIYGNHDVSKSLEIFTTVSKNITVVEEASLICRVNGKFKIYEKKDNPDSLFYCFPYIEDYHAQVAWAEETGKKGIEKVENKVEYYIRNKKLIWNEETKHLKVPRIGIAHGTMVNATRCEGQNSWYLNNHVHYVLETFEGLHYVALGHIHKYQTFKMKSGLAAYPGSIYSCNYSELDEKTFLIVEIDKDFVPKITPILIDCKIRKREEIFWNEIENMNRKDLFNHIHLICQSKEVDKEKIQWEVKINGPKKFLIFLEDLRENKPKNVDLKFEYEINDEYVLQNGTTQELSIEEKVKNFLKNLDIEYTESIEHKLNVAMNEYNESQLAESEDDE